MLVLVGHRVSGPGQEGIWGIKVRLGSGRLTEAWILLAM